MSITTIGFDGDDTLWHNETHLAITQEWFRQLLASYAEGQDIDQRLFETEMRNLRLFGYGVKGFTLSMIETAIEVSKARVTAREIQAILDAGKQMLERPVELLGGVRETLERLAGSYRLMLITKGDLFHQESRVAASGLGELFAAVEIVSEKDEATYRRVLRRHGIAVSEFLMVGNSLRSDVSPVIAIGGRAAYVPYHTTWQHEVAAEAPSGGYWELAAITELAEKLAEDRTPAASGEDTGQRVPAPVPGPSNPCQTGRAGQP